MKFRLSTLFFVMIFTAQIYGSAPMPKINQEMLAAANCNTRFTQKLLEAGGKINEAQSNVTSALSFGLLFSR